MMDIFVLPSTFDDELPTALLEAMAAGVPPIGTISDSVSEAIRNRWNGLLTKPNNATELARAISTIIDGEVSWSELRENAMKYHREQFSDQSMARGVADVYRTVLSQTD